MTNEELFNSIYNTAVDPECKNDMDNAKRKRLSDDCRDAYGRFLTMPGVTEEMKQAVQAIVQKMDKLAEHERVNMYGIGFRQGGRLAFGIMETPTDPEPQYRSEADLSFEKSVLNEMVARIRAGMKKNGRDLKNPENADEPLQ